ncbi:MAG: homocysteine S-methyltransferase family protein [Thermoleophilaceae bacterium]|nr:homocysteine S-methyltransferase family protein [Thermoleophilaceae bacterium]
MSHWLSSPLPHSPGYRSVERILAEADCVILDGGVATELQRIRADARQGAREPWGTWTLYQAAADVLELHRRYVAAGCDVISTNTWSILEVASAERDLGPPSGRAPVWEETARAGMRLARQAIVEAGRDGECAVAFCINGGLSDPTSRGELELLTWMWAEDPPDLVIVETFERIPDAPALEALRMVTETGLPVWVSFRRGRGGMSTGDGGVVVDPHPGAFAEAVGALEAVGVSALLVNCVSASEIRGALAALREAATVPVGCYPNLGRGEGDRWEFDAEVGPREYAELAEGWRAAGAAIIGGCCGVTPAHVRGVRERLRAAAL